MRKIYQQTLGVYRLNNMASRQQNSNEIFNSNPYVYPVLFLLIFLAVFFVMLKYNSYSFVKIYFLPIFNTFIKEVDFFYNNEIFGKIINILHLDFFIKKSYFYFNQYHITGDFTLVSLLNFVLVNHELPSNINIFKLLKSFTLGNIFVNSFNLIIVSPFIFFYMYKTKKAPQNKINQINYTKKKEEESKILKNLDSFNKDVDADLYLLMEDKYILSIKDVEVYLLEIIKYGINLNQFYNIYIKMFKNLVFVETKIKEMSAFNATNNKLFAYDLYKDKYSKYVYIDNNDKLQEKAMYMGKNKYNIYQYWILLFFYAKLVRNFPQAILAKKLGGFLKNDNIPIICKFSSAKNVPDYVTPYFFYYDLILSRDINSFITKLIDKKYSEKFLYKVI